MNPIVRQKILDFHTEGVPKAFARDLDLGDVQEPAKGNLVHVIIGVRRCGKTYRMFQEIQRILDEGHPVESVLYFNFEDDRLKPYSPTLLAEVIDEFYAISPQAKRTGAFLFFDEIQEVPDWGLFLRRLVDTEKATIYVSGSSSKMLSSEVATEFRGRSLAHELFPLSFSEYARSNGVDLPLVKSASAPVSTSVSAEAPTADLSPDSRTTAYAFTSTQVASLRNLAERYLTRGGFLDAADLPASQSMLLLQSYAMQTVNQDVIDRYALRNHRAATMFLSRCLASSGRELSVSKIHGWMKSMGYAVSRELLGDLLSYYEEAYLLFSVREFTRALAANPRSSVKTYAVDTGMFTAFAPAMSQERGQQLETAVFLKLRRQSGLIRQGAISRLLFDEGGKRHEIDFLVGDALLGSVSRLIQVCWEMDSSVTREREVSALRAAMRRFGLGRGCIVTFDDEETLHTDDGVIDVVPAWRWLLDDPTV